MNTRQNTLQAHDQASHTHGARLGELDETSREAPKRAEAAGKLAEGKFLEQKLKADNRNVDIEIQRHTDSTGPKPVNMRLGEERADAVRLFMNQRGVALNRTSTISHGPDSPVASNKTKAGRAQNRRVVVIVLA